MKGGFRKAWKLSKDAAASAWTAALPSNDYLDGAVGNDKMPSFPVSFDEGLGPKLDALEKLFKSKDRAKTKEARERLAAEARVILDTYKERVLKARDLLDEHDKRVSVVLLNGLKDIYDRVASAEHLVQGDLKDTFKGLVASHKGWKTAKKMSESAFKDISKAKETAKALKGAKLEKWPFAFTEGLGPAVEDFYKRTVQAERISPADRKKVADVVEGYGKAIDDAEKKLALALAKASDTAGGTEAIVRPLRDALAKVSKALDELPA